jgi:hypothetical protein
MTSVSRWRCAAPRRRSIPPGALRFPRIARWRIDKPASQADRLAQAHALLPSAAQGGQA